MKFNDVGNIFRQNNTIRADYGDCALRCSARTRLHKTHHYCRL